jgi:hypothetical protein
VVTAPVNNRKYFKTALPTRVLVEVDALKATFEENCVCKKCNGPVDAEVKTLCLATTFVISCKDEN